MQISSIAYIAQYLLIQTRHKRASNRTLPPTNKKFIRFNTLKLSCSIYARLFDSNAKTHLTCKQACKRTMPNNRKSLNSARVTLHEKPVSSLLPDLSRAYEKYRKSVSQTRFSLKPVLFVTNTRLCVATSGNPLSPNINNMHALLVCLVLVRRI